MMMKKNFTLIELPVVIAIIAILAGRTSASGYGAVSAAPLVGGVLESSLIATNRTCPIDHH